MLLRLFQLSQRHSQNESFNYALPYTRKHTEEAHKEEDL